MTRHKLTISAVAFSFALSALPVFAGQRPGGGEGGGPGGGGGAGSGSGGASVGGGGGGSSSGGGGSSTSSGGGSSASTAGSSGGGSTYAPVPSRREAAAERAPQRPGAASGERRGGGDRPRGDAPATGRAVPRGTTPSGRDTTTSTSSGNSDRERDRDRASSSPRDRAVPAYSRPRDGRPVTGRATDRFTPAPDRNGRDVYYSSPYPYGYYYDPYGYYGSYWYPGYSLGLGYFYYDPYWYGGYGYQGGAGYSGRYSYGESGSLRLKIRPRDAQVFVDGYFVGNVDSFDGVFQRLNVEAGGHKIEIRAPGHETLQFDVLITPGETVTYKGDLVRVQ